MRSNADLKAEYVLIQGQYEAFDQRALSLKGLATPLMGAGLAIGFKDASIAILSVTVLVALSLWVLEAIWKTFQYCFVYRISELEAWFRGEGEDQIPPFQIYSSWTEAWRTYSRQMGRILVQPFVCLPYVLIVLAGLVGAIAIPV